MAKTARVHPYRTDYEAKDIDIVHATIQYDCPYEGTTYILVIRNALHDPEMKNNLIPPFVIREAGVKVSDTFLLHSLEGGSSINDAFSVRKNLFLAGG